MGIARRTLGLGLLGVCVAVATVSGGRLEAAPTEVGLITGGERGTYYQFRLDMQ
jgi:TRAP-type uncharacterized transport system substrate-binding protein